MANWSNPVITTQYDVFVAEVKDRDIDSITMLYATGVNVPVHSIRYNRATKMFEEWDGSVWAPIVLAVAGGGTGGSNSGDAVAGLGLGTMAFQNSNAVGITGGTASLTWAIFSSIVVPSTDQSADLGDAPRRWRKAYVAGGLVIPVGVDKYVVG